MPSRLHDTVRGLGAFILAASAAPLAYIVSMPCGLTCAACPLAGVCILAYPVIVLAVVAVKSYRRLSSLLSRAMNRVHL